MALDTKSFITFSSSLIGILSTMIRLSQAHIMVFEALFRCSVKKGHESSSSAFQLLLGCVESSKVSWYKVTRSFLKNKIYERDISLIFT
jgi:hypothetical protein